MNSINSSFTTLSYRTPVPVRGLALKQNRFLKVQLLEEDYFLCVLPGFHQASLEEINVKLKTFFSHYTLNFEQIDFTIKFFNLIASTDSFLESIKEECLFSIEALLLGMIQKTHPHLFTYDPIALNLLYNEVDGPQFFLDADCIKIKINPKNAQRTIEIINELYKLNPEMIYRLDGNKKFELEELIFFEQALKKGIPMNAFKKIDYFEEPFKNFYNTILFTKRSELTIAIDESFIHYIKYSGLGRPSVIKPSLIGISPVIQWLKTHEKHRAIISSSFEHPSVMSAHSFIARLRPHEFHGLENYVELSK